MRIWIHLFVVVVLGVLIYANTMQVPFVYDDEQNLQALENPALNDLRCFVDADYAEQIMGKKLLYQNFPTRIVSYFTFALNYQLFDNSLTGYHLVNLVIHLLNGILVYCLMRLTMQTPFGVSGNFGGGSPGITAMLTALLFISHPVQTEAVTYISQRFTSLATLFYLLSLVCYISWRLGAEPAGESPNKSWVGGFLGSRPGFYALSLISALLAMKTKEISFTLPLMICLYEYFFFTEGLRRRWLTLLPLLLTMVIIPLAVFGEKSNYVDIANLSYSLDEAGSGNAILYLYTQFMVIVSYLRLLVLPVNQNLDYSFPLATGFFQLSVMLSFLFLSTLFGLGIYLFARSGQLGGRAAFRLRLISFGIFWFFLALSVESTFVPLLDVIFEHRLYLPSVGIFLALIAVVESIRSHVGSVGGRILTLSVVALILVWSGAAYARNAVWNDPLTLLSDIVSKSPDKSRPHYALGSLYRGVGRDAEAIREYKEAIRLEPAWVDSSFMLADIYLKQGNYAAALPVLEEAGKYQDARDEPQFYGVLGGLYMKAERFFEAERALRLAIMIDKHPEVPMRDLGEVYLRQKRYSEATAVLKSAMKLDPENSEINLTLAAVRVESGDYAAAVQDFQRALARNPRNEQARRQLEHVLALLKR
jgi:tetratricopeptide (TPR) repeat protein